jgi:hypothetical protein
MLTRNDATVENALDLVEVARPLGLKHIGFKDVGADSGLLRRLTIAIREAGASPWMEIVATTREAELRGVELGRDLGVEMLMGGVHVEEALKILEGSATRYLQFAGAPSGHPTRLGGSAPEVEAQCRAFAAKGCAGAGCSTRERSWSREASIRRNASPPFGPRARTRSPSGRRRSTVLTRPAPDRLRLSLRQCWRIAAPVAAFHSPS